MATNFVSRTTGELGFVRFFGGDAEGVMYEFGTVSQFERVATAMLSGDTFEPETGRRLPSDPRTAQRLVSLMTDGYVTFGRMSLTVEVGSGDMYNFTTEE